MTIRGVNNTPPKTVFFLGGVGLLQIKIKYLPEVQKCSEKVQRVLNVLKFPQKKLCDDLVSLAIDF